MAAAAAAAGALAATAAGAVPAASSAAFPASPARAGAARAGAVPPAARLDLVLSLRRDQAGLERFAAAVSDPSSPEYRRYASPAALARRFGAAPATRRAVARALRARGLRVHFGPTGAFAVVRATAAQAQALFSTRLAAYRAATGAHFVAPATPPALPPSLRGGVDGVLGLDTGPVAQRPQTVSPETIDFKARKKKSSVRANTGTPAGCPAGVAAGATPGRAGIGGYTPNEYLTAFGFDGLHRAGLRGQGQRVAVIEIDGFRRADVTTFGACFGLRVPPTPVTRVGIPRVLPPGDETTLDLEVLSAGAPALAEIQVYEGAATAGGLVRSFAAPLARPRGRRPSVISASIGGCEAGNSGATTQVRLLEDTLATAGAAGISVLTSAGDTGSTGCALPGNTGALGLTQAQYPASSPHVTGVGGTNVALTAANRIAEEVVWRDAPLAFGGGGGGASQLFDRPAWQRGPGTGGPSRLVPDVAGLADFLPGYAIYCTAAACGRAGWLAVGGTSAATPLLASSVAIANQQAARARHAPLGFLNPLIYAIARSRSHATVFRDVIRWDNDLGELIAPAAGGNGGPAGCCAARRGYDAASGWGSVNVAAFSSAARRLAARAK